MTTKELMVGDWVFAKKTPEIPFMIIPRIEKTLDGKTILYGKCPNGGIVGPFLEVEFQPIPLTPEILEKNGFRRAKEQETGLSTVYMSPYPVRVCEAAKVKVVFYDLPICGVNVLVQIEADAKSGGGVNNLHSCDIECVHQLQHALRLCGIEKNIEL